MKLGFFSIQEPCRARHTVHIQILISLGLESYRYGISLIFKALKPIFLNNVNEYTSFSAFNVKLLGLGGDDLQLIPHSAFQELKPRDFQIAKSLLSSKLLQVRMLFLNFQSNDLLFQ